VARLAVADRPAPVVVVPEVAAAEPAAAVVARVAVAEPAAAEEERSLHHRWSR